MPTSRRKSFSQNKLSRRSRFDGPHRRLSVMAPEYLESRQLMTVGFGAPLAVEAGHGPVADIAVGDLNGDGRMDLVANGARETTLLQGTGGGGFERVATIANQQRSTEPYEYYVPQLDLANADGDKRAELFASYGPTPFGGTGLQVFDYHSPDNVTRASNVYFRSYDGGPHAVADLNGDGRAEVITSEFEDVNRNPIYRLTVRSGDGYGVLHQSVFGTGAVEEMNDAGLAVGDVDGDGDQDIVFVSNKNRLTLLRQRSNGSFEEQRDVLTTIGRTDPKLADLDGDGDLDLIYLLTNQNQVIVHRNNGAGSFGAASSFSVQGDSPVAMDVFDVDGDGRMDVVTANSGPRNSVSLTTSGGDSVSLLLGQANGTLQFVSRFDAGNRNDPKIQPSDIHLADVTGDGIVDAVLGHDRRATSANSASNLITILPGIGGSPGTPDLRVASFELLADQVDVRGEDRSVEYRLTITNDGDGTLPGGYAYGVYFFLSDDATYDAGDTMLSSHVRPDQPMAPGGSQTFSYSLHLPAAGDGLWHGNDTYYVAAVADYIDQLDESNESNNSNQGFGIDLDSIRVVQASAAPELGELTDVQVLAGQFHTWKEVPATDADGDALTYTADTVSLARHLDQTLGLSFTYSYYENMIGMGEKWIHGDGAWYFITPMGQLLKWTGGWGASLTYEHVADLPTRYHEHPEQLHDAPDSDTGAGVQVDGNWLRVSPRRVIQLDPATHQPVQNFTEFEPFVVQVRVSDGQHVVSDSFVVSQTSSMAERLDAFLNFDHRDVYYENLQGQGEKYLSSSRGWYYLLPSGELRRYGDRSLVAVLDPVYHAEPRLLHDADAIALDHSLKLNAKYGYFTNWAGANEKWLTDASDRWYFILPNGDLYRWDNRGQSATGELIASLGAAFHQDPKLLHDSQAFVLDSLLGLEHTGTRIGFDGKTTQLFRDRDQQLYQLLPSGELRRLRRDGSASYELLANVDAVYGSCPDCLAGANDWLDDWFEN